MSSTSSFTWGPLSLDTVELNCILGMTASSDGDSDCNTNVGMKKVKVEPDAGQTTENMHGGVTQELGQSSKGNLDDVTEEPKQEPDIEEPPRDNNMLNGLVKNMEWEKEVKRTQKRRSQVLQFPQLVIQNALRKDITGSRLYDLDDISFYECEILKSNRAYLEIYIGKGWYEFVKDKKLKVGDKLIFNYDSDQEILYVRVEQKVKKNN